MVTWAVRIIYPRKITSTISEQPVSQSKQYQWLHLLSHEDRQKFLKALRNRQDLFQEEVETIVPSYYEYQTQRRRGLPFFFFSSPSIIRLTQGIDIKFSWFTLIIIIIIAIITTIGSRLTLFLFFFSINNPSNTGHPEPHPRHDRQDERDHLTGKWFSIITPT